MQFAVLHMTARNLARHVNTSLCISPPSNGAWSVAPNTQSFGLSSDHTSMTDPYSEHLHDFTNHKLLQFNLNEFSCIYKLLSKRFNAPTFVKTISQTVQMIRMVAWRRSET